MRLTDHWFLSRNGVYKKCCEGVLKVVAGQFRALWGWSKNAEHGAPTKDVTEWCSACSVVAPRGMEHGEALWEKGLGYGAPVLYLFYFLLEKKKKRVQ